MTETVLVIGGTGQLGAPVARQLRSDGYRVRLLVRKLPAAPDHDPALEYVEGDLDDTAALRRALAGCAAVHVSVRGGPTAEQYERVEHHGAARVAELAALAGVGRLTYVSHMLAAPDAAAPALRAKFRAEQAIAASAVPFTIFRPTYFMETLPRQVRGSRAVVLGRQPHRFHLLAARDFGGMVSRALAMPESAGQRLDGHGPQALTIADALGVYCEQLAPGTRVVTRPLWLMAVLDRTVLRGQLRGTLDLMRALQRSGERGDPSQANRLLGAPTTPLLQWCQQRRTRSHQANQTIPNRRTLTVDSGRSILTPGRAGWSQGHGSGVPPAAQRHPPGEGAAAPSGRPPSTRRIQLRGLTRIRACRNRRSWLSRRRTG
jgi:uncharacterized protein YbjT (DUF2867 family)